MSVRTDIIRDALEALEQPDTVGPDDSTDPIVKRLVANYERRAKVFLQEYPWNFASKIVQLSADSDTPSGWDYGFNKPNKMMRILQVYDSADMHEKGNIIYEDRGGLICTNYETTWLRYVDGAFADNDSGAWPETAKKALAFQMADLLSGFTAMGQSSRDKLTQRAMKAYKDAKRWDAQQMPLKRRPSTYWQRQRFGGGPTSEPGPR